MLKIGITGGIGSGKSVVCQVFETLGIPVFYADDAARHLMENDSQLIASIQQLLGTDSYLNNKPNRDKIAQLVFNDKTLLQKLNALVHPATIQYAADWIEQQTSPYIIKEAAIFFESGSYKEMDIMVGVSAPKEVRLRRALKRGGATEAKVLECMANQMDEDEKMKRCDHVIINDDRTAVLPQVTRLHELFLAKAISDNAKI